MDSKLFLKALGVFFGGIVLLMVLVFLPIGTVGYDKGWILLGLVFVPLIIIGALILSNDPDKLRHIRTPDPKTLIKKKETIILLSILLVGLVMYGLSYRFQWVQTESAGTIVGTIFFIAGYAMFLEVMRETGFNLYIDVPPEDQELIDTNLYGIIRHPMYASTILMFMFVWLLLGSWITFFISFGYTAFIIVHIIFEERDLAENMPGYTDYQGLVKYRLIPFIW